jgi:hypothetical protein
MPQKPTSCSDTANSNLIAYIIFSGILMVIILIMLVYVTPLLIEAPTEQMTQTAFIDIGNGMSTAIVDTYAFSNMFDSSTLTTKVSIPTKVLGKEYDITIKGNGTITQISRDQNSASIALPGISLSGGGVISDTISSSKFKQIYYNSGGV